MLYYTGLPAINSPIDDMDWDRLELKESNDSVFKDWDIRKGRVIAGRDIFNLAGMRRAVLDMLESCNLQDLKYARFHFSFSKSYPVRKNDLNMVMLLKDNEHWDKIKAFLQRELLYTWDSFLWEQEHQQWKDARLALMNDFMRFVNEKTYNLVLKGSAALMLCHGVGVPGIIESLELDGCSCSLPEIAAQFISRLAHKHKIVSYDENSTGSVQKIVLHYGNGQTLSINAGCSKEEIKNTEIANGYLVYEKSVLMQNKIADFIAAGKIADLHDLIKFFNSFIRYWNDDTMQQLHEMAEQCRLELAEYLLFTQDTPWLDKFEFQRHMREFYYCLGYRM